MGIEIIEPVERETILPDTEALSTMTWERIAKGLESGDIDRNDRWWKFTRKGSKSEESKSIFK